MNIVINMERRKNIENHLYRLGRIVDMSRNEAISAIKTSRHTILATIIMALGTFALVIGPMPGKYGGISIQDFCWTWLF